MHGAITERPRWTNAARAQGRCPGMDKCHGTTPGMEEVDCVGNKQSRIGMPGVTVRSGFGKYYSNMLFVAFCEKLKYITSQDDQLFYQFMETARCHPAWH